MPTTDSSPLLKEIAALRAKIDDLTYENQRLRKALSGDPFSIPCIHLNKSQLQIVGHLLHHAPNYVPYERFCWVMGREVSHNLIACQISKINSKFRPRGMKISNYNRLGPYIDAESAKQLRELAIGKRQ